MDKRIVIMTAMIIAVMAIPYGYSQPIIDKNTTIEPTLQEKYDELEEEYLKTFMELQLKNDDIILYNTEIRYTLSSNTITYYYYGDDSYPYPAIKVSSLLSHNPSYGENDTYLGQFVDSYFNDNYVNITSNVVHNGTEDCMMLNYSSGLAWATEDFTLYTEVEEANEINIVNSTYADCTLNRAWTSYAWYDLGTDALGDFKLYCLFRLDYHNADAWGGYTFMSNHVESEQDHRTNDDPFICWVISGTFGKTQALEHDSTGTFYSSGGAVVVPDDTYYWVKFEKNGTLLEYDAYTTEALRDAEGNGDLYDGQITLQEDYEFRYIYICQSHDDNLAKEENLELYNVTIYRGTTGYSLEGYYYTEELLSGDRALNTLLNTTIPTNTTITLEFSTDNSTWVNHNNVSGYESLVAGFEAIDLRDINTTTLYARFNLTTSNNSITPRVSQLRLVTITTVTAGGIFYPLMVMVVIATLLMSMGLLIFRDKILRSMT